MKTSTAVHFAFVGLAVCGVEGPEARADIMTLSSLEWMVSSADYVVDGMVTDRRPVPGRPGEFFIGMQVSGGALKGNSGRWFNARVRGPRPARGQRVVVFATNRLTPGTCGRDPRTGKTHYNRVPHITRVLDGRRNWSLPTRDFGRVVGIDALRKRIRAVRGKGSPRFISLPVPGRSTLGRRYPGVLGGVVLRVPRDGVTEAYLLRLLRSKAPDERMLGVTLLVGYESLANIRRLLTLCRTDPATISDGQRHPVREAAEAVLKRWRVPLPGPPGGQ